jgi:hypothetical protein
MKLPKKEDFSENDKFYIKEFDVPLVQVSDGKWFNWFGGTPREYDVTCLKLGNNWAAESFEEWVGILKESL